MLVKHILGEKGRDVVTITADVTVADAARILTHRRIGAVVVHGEGGSLAGILSERDVVRAISEESTVALSRPVSAFMTREVTTCTEHDSIDGLMEKMTHQRFRHVPVLDNGRLIGIISIGDVVKTRIEETVREAANLRDYIATG